MAETALVTGATSGIGESLCLLFAAPVTRAVSAIVALLSDEGAHKPRPVVPA